LKAIAFNVFSRNAAAQAFYRGMGYEPTIETRQKQLRPILRLERPEQG